MVPALGCPLSRLGALGARQGGCSAELEDQGRQLLELQSQGSWGRGRSRGGTVRPSEGTAVQGADLQLRAGREGGFARFRRTRASRERWPRSVGIRLLPGLSVTHCRSCVPRALVLLELWSRDLERTEPCSFSTWGRPWVRAARLAALSCGVQAGVTGCLVGTLGGLAVGVLTGGVVTACLRMASPSREAAGDSVL